MGEVYAELQGLQVWVVGYKSILFKITVTEQQIFEQKEFSRIFKKKSKFIAQSNRILEGGPKRDPHLVVNRDITIKYATF